MIQININDIIRNYRITQLINEGFFADSFLCEDKNTKAEYFLKAYKNPLESDSVFIDFFKNQCALIEKLNNMPSVTEKFEDHFIENGMYFQVKQKLSGINLDEFLQTNESYEVRKQISIILTGVIRNMHEQGIIHQDLKPGQVMMVNDELGIKTPIGYRAILSDFDWAIPEGKCVEIVGTIYYKSPEHYREIIPDEKSDIFTLGIIIFEMLTGQNPYDFDDAADDEMLKSRVLKMQIVKRPSELNPEIPKDINDILLACLNPEPYRRPTTDELQTSLTISVDKMPLYPLPGPLTETEKVSEPTHELSSVHKVFNQCKITADSSEYIVYKMQYLGRDEIKRFFADIIDDTNLPVYKYCEQEMIEFTLGTDGNLYVNGNETSKNYFLLNGKKLGEKKLGLKENDKLELFSVSRSKVIAEFTIRSYTA